MCTQKAVTMIDFNSTLTDDDIAVVQVAGQLEAFSCPYFFGCMVDLIGDGHREIVIDCGRIGPISNSCLNNLMKARQKAKKAGGHIVLANVNATILDVVGLVGLKRMFGVYPSVDHALATLRRKMRRQMVAT